MNSTSQAGLPFSQCGCDAQLPQLAGGTSSESYRDMAERIYEAYPRRVARPKAILSIMKAGRKFGFPKLAERTAAYAAAVATKDPQFIPHPATWFNQERFNDDPSTWNPGTGKIGAIEKAVALEEYRLCKEQLRLIRASYDPNQSMTTEDRVAMKKLKERERELKQQLGMKI